MTKSLVFALTVTLLLGACSSLAPKKERQEKEGEKAVQKESPLSPTTPAIDMNGLERSLGMVRAEQDLGYSEQTFNSCEVGYGFSSSHNCRKLHFVVIHFLLQCRNSEGTESSVAYSVQPIVTPQLRWTLGPAAQGVIPTTSGGYGRIRWISARPLKGQKLRLTHKGQFLILTAGDTRRIVTPKSWCEN